jgi:hypothetical protein
MCLGAMLENIFAPQAKLVVMFDIKVIRSMRIMKYIDRKILRISDSVIPLIIL